MNENIIEIKYQTTQRELFEFYLGRMMRMHTSCQNPDAKFAIMVCWQIMEDLISDLKSDS